MPRIIREPLTLKVINQAKPTGKLYRLRDATVPGLLLRVTPAGTKVWAITWGRGQERVIGTYPVMTLEGAREAARRELGEAAEHGAPVAVVEARKPASEKPITLGDFIRDHFAPWALANQKQGQATVDALEACFGGLYERELRSIAAFDIERFKTARKKHGIKPATINRDLDRIRKVYSCAFEWDFLTEHPLRKVKRIKVDNVRVRYLSDSEDKELRKALAAREVERRASRVRHNAWHEERGSVGHPQWPKDGYTDHIVPMVLLALNTGLRRGELFGLEWGNLNLQARLLTVEAGNAKSGKTRHLPLNDDAMRMLKQWKKQGDGKGLVFPSSSGARFNNINKAWSGIVAAAKLPDFNFHDLRHDFASKLVMAGVDLNTVRELLGHADIKMTLRYAHLAPGKLADAVSRINRT
ncbi:tyrosine-type recombinase/integrase [Solilutibacter silvestris]|uniref:Phage integrase family protein n=1 Tax=Solilutibacter silvestris TaxID=1645665 RepID=A0A2K1Q442_9GAMM|nr:tyrosine-type recombinase/integrase [Lysobacter silvestris]PNS09820.1 Phage integrase family protein [Lysobacter silvestris]